MADPKLTLVVFVRNRKSVAFANRKGIQTNIAMDNASAHPAVKYSSKNISSERSCAAASAAQTNAMKLPMMNSGLCFFNRSRLIFSVSAFSSGNKPNQLVNTACAANGAAQ